MERFKQLIRMVISSIADSWLSLMESAIFMQKHGIYGQTKNLITKGHEVFASPLRKLSTTKADTPKTVEY